ncbi:hypothetical protein C0Q70_01133 [Pomacea canaliculata]|uniref:Hexosyltransferase n=1 Tax=Pomacea canaliculata TaxID=400727 RepID=A0A2T7PYN7_POMCA|nr:hypothetical protein C0Q70_01133 [Pomacea canaliculata]
MRWSDELVRDSRGNLIVTVAGREPAVVVGIERVRCSSPPVPEDASDAARADAAVQPVRADHGLRGALRLQHGRAPAPAHHQRHAPPSCSRGTGVRQQHPPATAAATEIAVEFSLGREKEMLKELEAQHHQERKHLEREIHNLEAKLHTLLQAVANTTKPPPVTQSPALPPLASPPANAVATANHKVLSWSPDEFLQQNSSAQDLAMYFMERLQMAEVLKGFPYKTEYEVIPFNRFTLMRIYLVEPGLGKRVIEKPIGNKKKELYEIIAMGIDNLNHNRTAGQPLYGYEDFVEGIYRVEPTAGTSYELYFQNKDAAANPHHIPGPDSYVQRCRLNAEREKQVYYPIVFSLYNPSVVYSLQDIPIPSLSEQLIISKDTGFWRDFGYGMTCQYRSDFLKIKGFDEQIMGWGGEDVFLYQKYVRSEYLVIRATDPGIFHLWHEKVCDPKLSSEQYRSCIRSKALTEASHSQLGLLAFKDEINVHRSVLNRAEIKEQVIV